MHNEKIKKSNKERLEKAQRNSGRELDAELTPALFVDEDTNYTLGVKKLLLVVYVARTKACWTVRLIRTTCLH